MGQTWSIRDQLAVETPMSSSGNPHGTAAQAVRGARCAAAAALLAGCAVGPNFKPPAPPEVAGVTAQPPPVTAATAGVPGGAAQRFVAGADISGQWWTLFHSKALNALIDEALANSPDLKAAQAALRAAHEAVLAQRGAYFPSVTASASASRQNQPLVLAPALNSNTFLYSLFTSEVSVAYTPDVFGLNRRTVESLRAQAQAVRYQELAADTALTANVAVTAIQLAAADDQVSTTRSLIATQSRLLQILRYQRDRGYASGLDVAAQKSQLAQTQASLPPLVKQASQLADALADLVGRFPSQAPKARLSLADLALPRDLPLSLPSALVEQRPDVLQAEANLHAASAEVGIAAANRLPSLQLTANSGATATAIGGLFAPGTGFWGLGAALTTPIFEGGALLHKERAARAAYDEAAQQYRSTVLTAFRNVADSLAALEQDAQALSAAAAAAEAAKTTLDGAERQLKDGYVGYPAFLAAEQAYQQTQISLVQAEANRFADTAALFQALGGGWWRRGDLAGAGHHD
jgi:NodT family efflux transporter outer membrane factor (OMF) lipoprotein